MELISASMLNKEVTMKLRKLNRVITVADTDETTIESYKARGYKEYAPEEKQTEALEAEEKEEKQTEEKKEKSLSKMNKAELTEIANGLGIEINPEMTNQEIKDLIESEVEDGKDD